MRRVVAIEIKAAFADRHHLRIGQQGAQRREGACVAVRGVVRMDTGGAVQVGMHGRKRLGCAAALNAGPGDDDLSDARCRCPCQHRSQVPAKGVVREIGADVNDCIDLLPRHTAEYT